MSSEWSEFLSRDDVIGGLPARRASTLLFTIESRTAHLVARSRRAMAQPLNQRSAAQQEQAFLEALAQGRGPTRRPSIQDLERYAPEWASLVPDDAGVRAVLARMIGEHYIVPHAQVPSLRDALGLDDAQIQRAFERLHDRPLASIYAERVTVRERVRWVRAKIAGSLERLPPFWIVFALTLTETVGAGILALPIALAVVGPLAGLLILVVLGIVNVVTIAAMAESVARDGDVRYGNAYFGRLVTRYLGRSSDFVLTPALVTISVVILFAYYIGFSTTLADATGLSAMLWVAILFGAILLVLRRESLDATIASAILVGASSITLILVLSLLSLPHVSGDNLRYSRVPFVSGEPFSASIVELIFGVVLLAYFGHTSSGNCAAVVLKRDPGGRSVILGSVAAIVCAMALYCVWVVAVNGAVGPVGLAGETSTALVPLATVVGPSVHIVGALFVILAMGMASIHVSLGLYNLVRERLPAVSSPAGSAFGRVIRSYPGRYASGILPAALIFLAVEWLLFAERESFTGPLGFLGVITAPILGGMFPMLMLVAARRRGDYALSLRWRVLSHPVVVVGVYLVFLASIFLHGLVIWEQLYQRVVALIVGVVVIAVTVVSIRQGSLRRVPTVELLIDLEHDRGVVVTLTSDGEVLGTGVQLTYLNGVGASIEQVSTISSTLTRRQGLQSATIDIPNGLGNEVKVWAHRLTADGKSESLPARVSVIGGDSSIMDRQDPRTGQTILALGSSSRRIEIWLPEPL